MYIYIYIYIRVLNFFLSFSSFNNSPKLYINQTFELMGHLNYHLFCWFDHYAQQLFKRKRATSSIAKKLNIIKTKHDDSSSFSPK